MIDDSNPQSYFGPVTVLFHPNVGYGLNTRKTSSVVLNRQKIDLEAKEEYQSRLIRRPSKILPGRRVVDLIDQAAHEYFIGWAKDDSLATDLSLPKLMDEQLSKVYERTLMVDEKDIAPWVAEVYQPWIMLAGDRDAIGIKPRDVVDALRANEVDYKPLVGTTSQELRLAFMAGSCWTTKPQYLKVDLGPRQIQFYERVIERPDLIIG